MTNKAWKKQERQVAAMLGTTRTPNNGYQQTDIVAGPFAVEHKARKSLPTWLTDALQQARNGAEGRTPVVVLTEVRQGVRAKRYVVMDFADWTDWYGPAGGGLWLGTASAYPTQGRLPSLEPPPPRR